VKKYRLKLKTEDGKEEEEEVEIDTKKETDNPCAKDFAC